MLTHKELNDSQFLWMMKNKLVNDVILKLYNDCPKCKGTTRQHTDNYNNQRYICDKCDYAWYDFCITKKCELYEFNCLSCEYLKKVTNKK